GNSRHPGVPGGVAMRMITVCVLAMSLVGCHIGPRRCMRDHASCGDCRSSEVPPPAPAPENDSRTNSQAARAKEVRGGGTANGSARSAQTARKGSKPATSQDETVKQLQASLEKAKRDKANLQAKLSEESLKQTQQRLELEARVAVLQEQLRQ